MRRLSSIGSLLLVCLSSFVTVASAQDCTCPGSLIGSPYAGGDGQPLKWLYEPRILASPPPPAQKLLCYFKQVTNQSNYDVRDVRWEIANFYRRIVPKGGAPASCPQVAGEPKPTPTNGPLNYGPSAQGYDTTVLQPKDGWGDTASAESIADANKRVASAKDTKLNTAISFYVDVQDVNVTEKRVVLARVIVGSAFRDVPYVRGGLTYFVSNESPIELGVFINLSASSALIEKVPMIQRVLWVRPGQTRIFDAAAEGSERIESAAIVIYDPFKQVAAMDAGAFFTVAGKKELPDSALWQRLR